MCVCYYKNEANSLVRFTQVFLFFIIHLLFQHSISYNIKVNVHNTYESFCSNISDRAKFLSYLK